MQIIRTTTTAADKIVWFNYVPFTLLCNTFAEVEALRDSNPWLLGEVLQDYLCAMPPPEPPIR